MFRSLGSLSVSRRVVLVMMMVWLAQAPLGGVAQGIKDAGSGAENGLEGEHAYTSPQFGVEVEWGDAWSPNQSETVSDPATGVDQLRIGWEQPGGNIRIFAMKDGRGGPPEDVAYWTSEEFFDDAYPQVDEVEVLLEEPGSGDEPGAVLIGLADAGDPEAYIYYAQSLPTSDGRAVYVVLDARVSIWEEVLASAQEAVTIDGETSFDVFDEEEVEAAVADTPVAEYSYEGAGLEDGDRYVSPAFGYEVTWPASWEPNPVVRYPVVSKSVVMMDEVHIAENDPEADPPPFFDFHAAYVRQTTMEQELAYLIDPDWVSLGFREEVEVTVLLSDSGEADAESFVAITFPETGEVEYAWFRFARDGDRADLYIYLKARSDGFEDAWETMTSGEIAIDGDPVETVFTWDEIEKAIAEFEG